MLLLIAYIKNENTVIGIVYYTPINTPQDFRCISLLNLKTCALLLTLFLKYISRFECEDTNDIFILLGKIASKSTSRLITVVGTTINHAIRTSSIFLLAFLCLLNFKLIAITNPSITNPGLKKISVLYSNIQRFMNTRDLTNDSPPLNITKLHEINGYIFTHAPDIIIMKETWLKPSILSSEFFF